MTMVISVSVAFRWCQWMALQPLLPDAFVVSETEDDAGEDDGQTRFDQAVSDGDDLERQAERIRKTYGGRMGHTRDSGDDDNTDLLPSMQDPELWMLRTKVGQS
jgi:hypothetical protein